MQAATKVMVAMERKLFMAKILPGKTY